MSAAILPVDPQPIDRLTLRGAPDARALVLKDRVLTYADLEAEIGMLAGWLAQQGFAAGDRVASWSGKGWLTCLLPLAAPRAGLVHVPVNPALKHAQVSHILADSGARLLIANKGRLDGLAAADVPEGCILLDEADRPPAADALPIGPSDHDPNALAAILYTSGSTGRPKGVMLSHANLWLGAEAVAHYLHLTEGDRTLSVLPLAFDYGQNQLLSTWFAGGAVVPIDYLLAREVVKAVARHGITTLAAVPPLWVQLLEQVWPQEAVTPLRRLTNSGGALGEPLVRRLRARFPDADFYAMYGLTEAFRSTYLPPDLIDAHPTSIGGAIPHAEVLVVKDDGDLAGPGEEGELVHAGPLVAQGYWHDADKTAERFRPAPSGSKSGGIAAWSGDRVRYDAEGLLYFVGRRDAMIKSLGQRVSPQEIEEIALATGFVAECVALGLPDPALGQAIHLVVRAPAGTDPDDVSAPLVQALRRELPTYMQPQAIHWRDALPKGATGKLDRVGLARELAGEAA
ncbi:acyl-CoA ligase (AMP-forming), exosortase A system-associated [Croceicoccus naphthovorans]|uniref:AMP-binding protein n=1 Tax=Croceicoccus naphthovorans TaxID=1348774 RepID=A0A0G3XED7_9SPHN|nr:acyl-CoA ligase (AMP-forming), exosortase A system-associated [Croceicoccus naphthovorans]AKM09920.1 AMP-binding protein [Croceicoccus naphthovorans]MBB3990933.1 acyl-CoA ligase (AMP-forming) (exosortase A-associated) [Croceicoccus naphthovorans]